MDKKEFRKISFEKRDNLFNDINMFNHNSLLLQNSILNSELYKNAKIICAYMATKSEISVNAIIEQSLLDNKIVLLPRCDKKEKGKMDFYQYKTAQDIEQGYYGILEPKINCQLFEKKAINSKTTLLLVPALAFNTKGFRLGYGQGFYDRFMGTVPQAISIGITFSSLINNTIPQDPWDLPVQYLATENEIIKTK